MKERPILFNGDMVRAILDGRKTQTRRTVISTKDINGSGCELAPCEIAGEVNRAGRFYLCPYGEPGDRLWVRETWGVVSYQFDLDGMMETWTPDRPVTSIHEMKFGRGYYNGHIIYAADGTFEWCDEYGDEKSAWKPSIHMPRAASRILLEIVNVRVERLQDIGENDAKCEGAPEYEEGIDSPPPADGDYSWSYVASFRKLWDSIYQNWQQNPWVWVIEFKVVH
jgi:hypothetical protein